jgi:hypothetical protein
MQPRLAAFGALQSISFKGVGRGALISIADSDEFSRLYRNDFSHRSDLISPGARAILAGNMLWHQGCREVNLFELFFDAFFEGFRR